MLVSPGPEANHAVCVFQNVVGSSVESGSEHLVCPHLHSVSDDRKPLSQRTRIRTGSVRLCVFLYLCEHNRMKPTEMDTPISFLFCCYSNSAKPRRGHFLTGTMFDLERCVLKVLVVARFVTQTCQLRKCTWPASRHLISMRCVELKVSSLCCHSRVQFAR